MARILDLLLFSGGRSMPPAPEELVEGLTILDPLILFSEPSSPPTLAAPNVPSLHLGAAQKIAHAACHFQEALRAWVRELNSNPSFCHVPDHL